MDVGHLSNRLFKAISIGIRGMGNVGLVLELSDINLRCQEMFHSL